jgi:hypothetical protein
MLDNGAIRGAHVMDWMLLKVLWRLNTYERHNKDHVRNILHQSSSWLQGPET